ncbi:MAG: GNAT family N-acetyltransferase [Burkholderiales bacterium]|jgi:CelD/BcsL family acetyltransferase involved in cellulose biosynthesis|nr:GNAT family N-acetyltransferase [Burkholderiales bacterium]
MSIKAIRTLQDLDGVRAHWEQWQSHANNDLAQFELVCRVRTEVECPYVTVIERDGRPHVLVAGRLERTTFAPAIGYIQPVRIPATVLTVIHQGVMGPMDDETASQAVHYLRSLLRSGVADAVAFHHLSEHSPLFKALQLDRSTWLWERTPRWSTHREMMMSPDKSFLEQKVRPKHRSQFRKRQKELEASFSGKVAWRWITEFDDIPALCARLEAVAAKTYQRALNAGFFDNEEYRRRFELFASRKQLRVQLLEIDGSVRAFWFGTVYQGVFHSSETGYDPDLRDFEVGTLMFIRMADELMHEGIRRLDFGLGDAPYKARFGDHFWRETPAWLFAPSAKGVVLMLLLKLCLLLDTTARRLVEGAGLTDKIKTYWRRHMGKSDSKIAEAARQT